MPINRSRTWYRCYLLPLNWYCQIVFCCDCMIKFALKRFNISGNVTPCVYTGPDHLTQSMRSKVHITARVITKVHPFVVLGPFRAPPPWSPNNRSVTDNCHNIISPIYWPLVALHNAEIPFMEITKAVPYSITWYTQTGKHLQCLQMSSATCHTSLFSFKKIRRRQNGCNCAYDIYLNRFCGMQIVEFSVKAP